MQANFARSLAAVLRHEGGYVNNPKDKGGPTNKGITLATFRKYVKPGGTVDDLKRITDAQVAKCYRSIYWDGVRGDALPSGLDYAVFDYAVNSGVSRASKAIQTILGVTVDGDIGPKTILAARSTDGVKIINALCDQRIAFLKSLSNWATFGGGWQTRVADVREDAIQLVQPSPRPSLLSIIIDLILKLFRKK